MKLLYKLVIPVVFILVVAFAAIALYSAKVVEEVFVSARTDDLSARARLKAATFRQEDFLLDPQEPLLQEKFREMMKIDVSIFRLNVWDRNMNMVYSDIDVEKNPIKDPFVDTVKATFVDASQGIWSGVVRANVHTPEGAFGPFIMGTVPIRDNGGQIYYVAQMYSSAALLLKSFYVFGNRVLGIFALVVVVIFVLEYIIFLLFILRPVHVLKISAETIGSGNLNEPVSVTSRDEIGDLARSFGVMAGKIKESQRDLEEKIRLRTIELEDAKKGLEKAVQARTQELEDAKSGLEQAVQVRTQELERKIEESERMNKAMVGRELKMIELKKEIERLNAKVTS